MDTDLCRQIEEVETLSAIYGDEWCDIDCANRIYCIRIDDALVRSKWSVCLQVTLPEDYPSSSPPLFQLNAPWLRGDERCHVEGLLGEVYASGDGEPVIYACIERVREYLQKKSDGQGFSSPEIDLDAELAAAALLEDVAVGDTPDIAHGPPFVDRKSVFQAHVARVTSKEDAQRVMGSLLINKKIRNATHNISAFVIHCKNGTILSDCCDDGEHQAGSRLLHLLRMTGVENVMVVVSRWFGGILLGPDRFKHILNVARDLLVEQNMLEENASKKANATKKK